MPDTRRVGTNHEDTRRHNLATLLWHVHRTSGLSRARLTARMGLTRSTIADLVRELEELGLVTQSAPEAGGAGRAGRPSHDVRPVVESAYVLAAELGVHTLDVARVGLGGEVLTRRSAPTPTTRTEEALVPLVARLLREANAEAGDPERLVGIGIAVPGVVSDRLGLVRFAPNLGWTDVSMGARLEGEVGLGVRVRLGNDAELGALAEHTRGAGDHIENLIYLSCDEGVGAGVIVSGIPLSGASGYAGEVGHLRFSPGGRTCRCGNRGCWETEIGWGAVATALGCGEEDLLNLGEHLTPGTAPTPALREVGRALGEGLGGLVNIFNPELLILGGVLRRLYPIVADDVHAALDRWALSAPAAEAHLSLPGLGADSVVIGAAELAFGDLFTDPVGVLQDDAAGVIERTVG